MVGFGDYNVIKGRHIDDQDFKGNVGRLIREVPAFKFCTIANRLVDNGVEFILKDGYTLLAEDISKIIAAGIRFSISSEDGKCYIRVYY